MKVIRVRFEDVSYYECFKMFVKYPQRLSLSLCQGMPGNFPLAKNCLYFYYLSHSARIFVLKQLGRKHQHFLHDHRSENNILQIQAV